MLRAINTVTITGPCVKKPIRWVAGYDNHGDQFDPATMKAFWAFVSMWKPTIRISGGDIFDFRHLRSKAGEGERYESGQRDFQCGLDFIRKLNPTHICLGNHDSRLYELRLHPNANVRDQAERMIEEIEHACGKASVIPYSKRQYHQIGNLKVNHGFAHGENAVRKAAAVYGRILHGHIHRVESVRIDGVDVREGYSSGCLCRVDLNYNARSLGTLRHENGWAYGEILPSGHTTVHLARRVGGVWHLPTEFRSIT